MPRRCPEMLPDIAQMPPDVRQMFPDIAQMPPDVRQMSQDETILVPPWELQRSSEVHVYVVSSRYRAG